MFLVALLKHWGCDFKPRQSVASTINSHCPVNNPSAGAINMSWFHYDFNFYHLDVESVLIRMALYCYQE